MPCKPILNACFATAFATVATDNVEQSSGARNMWVLQLGFLIDHFGCLFPGMTSVLGRRLVACLLNISEARERDVVEKVAQAVITHLHG